MFSTAQIDMINGLVAPMRAEGFKYYLAVSDNLRDTSSDPDLYIYFSTEEIYATDLYQYHIPGHSKVYQIRTSNGSSYNNTGARIEVVDQELSQELTVSEVEFVSTNATSTQVTVLQPDFTVGEVGQYEMQGSMLLIVCAFLLSFVWFKIFRR